MGHSDAESADSGRHLTPAVDGEPHRTRRVPE